MLLIQISLFSFELQNIFSLQHGQVFFTLVHLKKQSLQQGIVQQFVLITFFIVNVSVHNRHSVILMYVVLYL